MDYVGNRKLNSRNDIFFCTIFWRSHFTSSWQRISWNRFPDGRRKVNLVIFLTHPPTKSVIWKSENSRDKDMQGLNNYIPGIDLKERTYLSCIQ